MERGENSGAAASGEDIWAKLVPLDSLFPDVELRSDNVTVLSVINSSSSEKQEWCRIEKNKDQVSALMKNMCSHSILVDDTVIQDDDTATITCGSEIILGPEAQGFMRYRFKVMPAEEICKKQLQIVLDPEHTKCSICLSVWHDVVTVAPCLHNFCNGCFSEWLKQCQEKHSSILCPQCRAVVQFVGRNHFLHNIEEDILQADSTLRRSSEDIALLDSHASIKSPFVISCGRKFSRKRARAPPDEENAPCPQCGNEYAGFRCNQSTIHLQCQTCGGMMPSRSNASVPQHCPDITGAILQSEIMSKIIGTEDDLRDYFRNIATKKLRKIPFFEGLGCDRAFCGAYWHSLGVTGSDVHPVCSLEILKPITERSVTRIPFLVHEKNRHEQDITEKCLRQMGRSLQDVISEWVTKMNNREIDRTRLPLNHSEMINPQTYVCNECYDKLVSFLLYWFRVTLPKHYLPPEALLREDCWYGSACRTQHHNEEHARKRNHVCRPTRGGYA